MDIAMKTEAKHKASLTTLYWEDIRKEVAKINPTFAKIVDNLSPTKKFPIYKVKYPFGARIAHEGQLYLPTTKGNVAPINSPDIPSKFKQTLQRRELPIAMVLKNNAEIFYEMPDRTISWILMAPGQFWGLWGQYDPPNANYFKWIWNLISGARTLYLLPKTTNIMGHKALKKKYSISTHLPKDYPDQWKTFVTIANSQNFETEWHNEWLFFPDIWFETALQNKNQNKNWQEFYNFLLQESWSDSHFWRNKSIFDLIWENLVHEVMEKNIKPNLYLACIVKQLVITGIGALPALTMATDDSCAPIKELQQAYTETYKLREYAPIFMCPHNFSPLDKFPSYYSLQYPNLFETVPIIQTLPSVLSSIPEICSLINTFKSRTVRHHSVKDTPIDAFCRHVSLDFFHNKEEKINNILPTSKLPSGDSRLSRYLQKHKNKTFPASSNLINGCVRFENNK